MTCTFARTIPLLIPQTCAATVQNYNLICSRGCIAARLDRLESNDFEPKGAGVVLESNEKELSFRFL